MEFCTRRHEPATYICTAEPKIPDITPIAAASERASSKTMVGDRQPSFITTRFDCTYAPIMPGVKSNLRKGQLKRLYK